MTPDAFSTIATVPYLRWGSSQARSHLRIVRRRTANDFPAGASLTSHYAVASRTRTPGPAVHAAPPLWRWLGARAESYRNSDRTPVAGLLEYCSMRGLFAYFLSIVELVATLIPGERIRERLQWRAHPFVGNSFTVVRELLGRSLESSQRARCSSWVFPAPSRPFFKCESVCRPRILAGASPALRRRK